MVNSPFKPRHAIYLLPNSFTTASLFAGFYAILKSIQGDWQAAAVAVIVAALLDACDGRIARWTGTQSNFGAEYDSLSDVISFGVAPAVLMWQWSLAELDKIGLGAVFCYCAATAIRLARFNSQSSDGDKRFFIGIPSPAAALIVVTFVASVDLAGIGGDGAIVVWITAVLAVWLAFTMVCGVRFYSFKDFNLRHRIPFRYAALIGITAMLLTILADNAMHLLFLATTIYLISGYAFWGWIRLSRWWRK